MDSNSLWDAKRAAVSADFGEGLSRALQSFQQVEHGVPTAGAAPEIKFSPDKLQELQKQYTEEAGKLWLQGLQGAPASPPTSALRGMAGPATRWPPFLPQPTC